MNANEQAQLFAHIFAHMSLGQSLKSQSGRQDSNLRPSAPKADDASKASL